MTPTAAQKEVAERIRELRERKGLSQDAVAENAGFDRKTLNRIENHHFAPNLDTLFRLCRALGTTPSKLMRGIEATRL